MNHLKAKSTIGKAALGAIAFFAQMRPCINLTALDAVIDDFGALRIMNVTIAPVIIKPETEEQNESCPQIEQEKDIHV